MDFDFWDLRFEFFWCRGRDLSRFSYFLKDIVCRETLMGLSHTILNRAFARRKMLGGRLELPFSMRELTPEASAPVCLRLCRRRDSNSHGFPHTALNRTCLPISPLRRRHWRAGLPNLPRTKLIDLITIILKSSRRRYSCELIFKFHLLIREFRCGVSPLAPTS